MKTLQALLLSMVLGVGGAGVAESQSAPPPAQPSAEALQAATELVQAATELMQVVSASMSSEMVTRTTSQVWPQIEAALRAQNNAIDAATIAELRQEFDRQMTASVSGLMKDAPAIYARYFTVQEMRELAAFYRTPTGAKTLRVTPQVSADLLAAMTPHLQGLQEKIHLAFLNTLQRRGLYAQ